MANPNQLQKDPRVFLNREFNNGFREAYPHAYSAADIFATIKLPGGQTKTLGSLAALSISTHRDAFPVTACGVVDAKGIVQGHRVIAGSLVFHTLDRNAFHYDINPRQRLASPNGLAVSLAPPHPDTLPLFDILLTYVNDYGSLSFETLRGVRLLDFGKTISLETLHPIETYSFMAMEYGPMEPRFKNDPVKSRFVLTREQSREPIKVRNSADGTHTRYDADTQDRNVNPLGD